MKKAKEVIDKEPRQSKTKTVIENTKEQGQSGSIAQDEVSIKKVTDFPV